MFLLRPLATMLRACRSNASSFGGGCVAVLCLSWLSGCLAASDAALRPPGLQDAPPPSPDRLLDLPLGVTGSFGEYRYGNFHYGIDISTATRTGIPVFAAGDGEVQRILFSRYGAGFAIFLRHANEYSTHYLHLDRFAPDLLAAPALQSIAERAALRQEFDFFPGAGALPVRAGQTIGFSGESGAGLPHLHYELWHEGLSLDPLQFGIRNHDTTAPVFRELRIEPGAPGVLINGQGAGLQLKLRALPRHSGAQRYALQGANGLHINGPIRLRLIAYDPSGRSRLGLAALEMLLDGRRRFHFELRSMTRLPAHAQLGLFYAEESRIGRDSQYCYNLFERLPGLLRFLDSEEGGLLRPPASPAQLEIRARDAGGNESVLTLALAADARPFLQQAIPAANLRPESELLLQSADHRLQLHFGERSVFEATRLTLSVERKTPPLPAGLRQLGSAYLLGPARQDFLGGYRGEIQADQNPRTRLFILNNGRLFMLDERDQCSAGKRCFHGRISGIIMLLEDRATPRWGRAPSLAAVGRRLILPASDAGAGIDGDRSRVWIDGRPAISEYDPDRGGLAIYGPTELLQAGRRQLQAELFDRAGNRGAPLKHSVIFR
ncbi:MAG: M23 family metallopeptidase [Leptospirales bacterium]|nr:M23 family metallopeptidase [Leptospirales bacterium]